MFDPIAKDFAYKDQNRGSGGGIMDTTAEGFAKSSKPELINSLTIAKGGPEELKSQLYRALITMRFREKRSFYRLSKQIC